MNTAETTTETAGRVRTVVANLEDTMEIRGLTDISIFGVEISTILVQEMAKPDVTPQSIREAIGEDRYQGLLTSLNNREAGQYLDIEWGSWEQMEIFALALQRMLDENI